MLAAPASDSAVYFPCHSVYCFNLPMHIDCALHVEIIVCRLFQHQSLQIVFLASLRIANSILGCTLSDVPGIACFAGSVRLCFPALLRF
jgi:hypothetical protein